jgi:ATP/maltotriose-dependent transcriptional regulator MalT/DNA-binding SARP family transcriptional activator
MGEMSRSRLTALVAGPGTGKTTLLRQVSQAGSVAWHTITPADASLMVFARSVVDALRLQAPEVPNELSLVLGGVRGPRAGPGGSSRPDALAAHLCQELERSLTHDVVLVLDDVQHVPVASGSAAFLAAMCRHAPPTLHLVVASRHELPFPIARMQLGGEAHLLGAAELAFSRDEVSLFVEQVGPRRDGTWGEALWEWTQGWAVAVVFGVRAGVHPPTDPERAGSDQQALFRYLAEEVVASEDPDAVALLRRAAALPWVTRDLLGRVPAGNPTIVDDPAMAVYLGPTSAHPNASTVMPLVREYLLTHHPLERDEHRSLLAGAAEWYEQVGAFGEALDCLREVGDDDAIVRFLRERGETALAAGLARPVVTAIAAVDEPPDDVVLLEAEALQMLGHWEDAMRRYEVLIPPVGPIPAAVAWRLGFLHHMRGDVEAAFDVYHRGVTGTGAGSDEAALLGWTASAHWLRGERDQAKVSADAALALARDTGDSRALATAHTVLAMVAALDGDRAANDAHYLRALEHADRARDVVQTIRIRSNRASHYLEEGDYAPAMAELDIALRLADLTGFELWRGLSLSNRAQVLFNLGRLDESIAQLEEARAIFRRLGSRLEAYPLAHLGDVYAARGDTALARTAYEAAIDMTKEPSDLQALVPALSGLARVLAPDEPDRASALAAEAAEVASVLGHVRALLAVAWVDGIRGDRAGALIAVRRAGDVAGTRRDLPGLAESLEIEASVTDDPVRAADLLRQSRDLWARVGSPLGAARVDLASAELVGGSEGAFLADTAVEVLRRLGAKRLAQEGLRSAQALRSGVTAEVEIKTLGGFAVTRGGVPVPNSAWQSRVAREILWMLIANRGRPLHREVLMERLWPDDEPAKTANRLSVALTTIRNVLDPERDERAERFLLADRESVALDLGAVAVDVEHFLEEAQRGMQLLRIGADHAHAVLRSAEARYVGDFLEEQPYSEWSIGLREEARAVFLTVAAVLAANDTAAGDHDAAARRYLRMLEQDRYNEQAHLGLVSAMVEGGRHGSARRLYGIYASRMTELGVEPSAFPASGPARKTATS